jgi:hypothetical protein
VTSVIPDQTGNPAYGDEFDYTVWDEGTTLTLVNVPWNNDYRDIVRFTDQDALDAWIAGKPNTFIDNTSLQRFQQDVYVDMPANKALKYNYLRASNPEMPVPNDEQRNYYYFITGIQPIAPNNTRLTLQLDVWQTFGYEVTFGSSYIERGHIGIANENAFDNYGRDYLNIPEGLDTGGEYRIVKTAREQIMGAATAFDSSDFSILVCSTIDLSKNPGDEYNPKLVTATGTVVDGIISGASFYVFPTVTDFKKFLALYSDRPWITQGIISVTIIPKISRYHPSATLTDVSPVIYESLPPGTSGPPSAITPDFTMYNYPAGLSQVRDTPLAVNWRDDVTAQIPARFRGLKKFLTYPYCVVEITAWNGKPLIARPEAWPDDDATIREQAVMLPPGQRISLIPRRYNADPATEDLQASDDDRGEYLDFSTAIDSFPNIPIVNNMAINFLAANNAGLAFSFSSAEWSQQRVQRGNEVRYRQATAGMNLAGEQNYISRNARLEETSNAAGMAAGHAIAQGLSGIGTGALMGGPAGAGAGAIGAAGGLADAAIAMQGMTTAAEIANRASLASTQAGIRTGEYMRDTNKSLADFAAQGDYQNAIAGTKARIQDSKLTQPSASGQFGGDAMNLAHARVEIAARFKLVDQSTIRTIGNFWLRYGYAVNEFSTIPSSFMCMTKFTYWKLAETYISQAPFPEGFKQIIRGIFEKGVTVWKTPEYIGNTDWADNDALDGITL